MGRPYERSDTAVVMARPIVGATRPGAQQVAGSWPARLASYARHTASPTGLLSGRLAG